MGQIRKVITGFEHSGVHQRWKVRVLAVLDSGEGRLDGLGLQMARLALCLSSRVATHLAILDIED